ncbi:MAG: mechanosensitive ion channel family protein [bacterium]|nr:mechanosensitive ion channel family protein [bacterium]
MEELKLLYDQVMQRVSPQQLMLAFGFVLGALVVRRVVLYMLERYVERLARISKTELDDLLVDAAGKPLGVAIVFLGMYLGVHSFRPPEVILSGASTVFSVLGAALLAWFMLRLVRVLTHMLRQWAKKTDSTLDDQLVPLVGRAAEVVVGILAGLMILQNMGYSVSGLIAGLGVGGLAVALGAQKTLSDLFGSVMLLVDRPFVLGDWVRSPDREIEGTVERIGFRSTRIRTFDQTLITIPNSRLADFVIDNVTQRPVRRVWITVRASHLATAAQMREVVTRIELILKSHPDVDQESFLLVRFTDFGEYSRDIMVYYFTRPIDWVAHLEVREEVNLKIMETLEDLGVPVALPVRAVHMMPDPAAGEAPEA